MLLILAGFMGIRLASIWAPILALLCLGLVFGMTWYLHKRLDVQSFKGFYWVDDEREKAIALKVHSTVMASGTYFLYGLLVIIFLLMNFEMPAQLLGRTILSIVWLALVVSNGQYYWLWSRYDQA